MMRLGSLCTGYGGLDLAAEHVLGPLQHTWHAEIDPRASKVLAHHWPTTPNLGDLTAVDWTAVPPVDVLTAGFPCQDVSLAGKGAGLVGDKVLPAGVMFCGCPWGDHQIDTCDAASPGGLVPSRMFAAGLLEEAALAIADLNLVDRAGDGPPPERVVKGTRTGVWKAIKTAIKELNPKIVLLENVRGLLSARADSDVEPCPWCLGDTSDEPVLRALGAVLADLADLGFDAEWTTVAASDVGAPHRRERVFIAAWPAADAEGIGHGHSGPPRVGGIPAAAVAGAAGLGALGVTLLPTPAAARSGRQKSASAGAAIRPSLDSITQLLPTPAARDWRSGESNIMDRNARPLNEVIVNLLPTPTVADSRGSRNATAGRTAIKPTTQLGWTLSDIAHVDRWGNYAPAIARWEATTGRTAPDPTETGTKGQPRLAPAFVEWLMGLPAGWVTDHLPRNPALKCLGNGVVWQQAAHAYTELLAGVR